MRINTAVGDRRECEESVKSLKKEKREVRRKIIEAKRRGRERMI